MVLTLMFLFVALAIGTTTVVGVESTVSRRFRDGIEALYVAEAGLALVVAELRDLPDWGPVLSGVVRSPLARGAFAGQASVAAGGRVSLCCGEGSIGGRLTRELATDPVPARRGLAWQPYLWSPWDALVPQPWPGPHFLTVHLQDDEGDGDADGDSDLNGVVVVRSEVVRPDGLRRAVEGVVARELGDPDLGTATGVRILRWREVR